MKRSRRTFVVVSHSASIAAVVAVAMTLALSFSGCKKRQLPQGPSEAQNGAPASHDTLGNNPGEIVGSHTDQSPQVAQIAKEDLKNSVGTSSSQNAAQPGAPAGSSAQQVGASQVAKPGEAPATIAAIPELPPELPKEPPVTCFLETFKHKKTAGHDSAEACSHHKNLVSVTHTNINAKSVCVRVNETPVKYERMGNGGEFLIGSIAGPDATITVRYCTGKTTCELPKKDDCKIPKDEFMDAIGGGEPEEGAVAQWENTTTDADAKLNNDVKRELADIDDSAPDGHAAQASVFKDWISEKPVPACGKKQSS